LLQQGKGIIARTIIYDNHLEVSEALGMNGIDTLDNIPLSVVCWYQHAESKFVHEFDSPQSTNPRQTRLDVPLLPGILFVGIRFGPESTALVPEAVEANTGLSWTPDCSLQLLITRHCAHPPLFPACRVRLPHN
jgi:hypothetical protein